MRLALTVLTTLTLLGCSGESALPTAPTSPALGPYPPTSGGSAWLWAMVVEESGICILDATIQVIAGQAAGQIATQSERCDAWSDGGVIFKDLTPGVEMTLRASVPGYVPQEKTVVPTIGATAGCHLCTVQDLALTDPGPGVAVPQLLQAGHQCRRRRAGSAIVAALFVPQRDQRIDP